MSGLTIPKAAGARSRSIESSLRTPDRPIVGRFPTNSSASPTTPGSICDVFDIDITADPPCSPLTPFASPPASVDGSYLPPPILKEFTARSRKSSSEPQSPTSYKQDRTTQKREISPTLQPPQFSPQDQKQQLSGTISRSIGQGSTSKLTSRPRLTREAHTSNIKSYHSEEDSADDAEIKHSLKNTTALAPLIPNTVATDVATIIPGSTVATAIDILESEDEDRPTAKDKPEQLQIHHLKFVPYRELEKDIRTLDSDVLTYILGKTKKTDKANISCELGYVYIFESPHHAPKHVKIGFTKDEPVDRLEKIQRECKIKLAIVKQEHSGAVPHYKYLETIIHLVLSSQRRRHECAKCRKAKSTMHDEWFEIPHDKALEQVKLWRDWITEKKPFNADGTLKDYWQRRAKKMKARKDTICWEEWTQPEHLDHVDYMVEWWQEKYWIRLLVHMERKDMGFWQRGTILSLLVGMRFGSVGFCFAVIALIAL